LALLKQREARLKGEIARLQNRAKQEGRKKDTRRKIILGAAVMAHARLEPEFARQLAKVLHVAVTKDADKELVKDFL
jgi:hypothetical protein